MAKGDPRKPKDKMSVYAFFVQTCREEHKKKNAEVPVNFATYSKKCSERWKTMSVQEKSKFDEMAEDYGPAKGGKKNKNPNDFQRPQSGFFLFYMAKKLGEMWNNLNDSEKQAYITKVEKDVADYKLKGKFDGAKGPAKVAQKKKTRRKRRRRKRRRRRNKETVYLSPCEYLRVGEHRN
uniref:HMG box domain-containing protein n=1 Tax=Nomascus leucogenys TaxID=61853 RepID=A0A2I3HLM7_NOMLE